jgi:hypothetical protein
MQEMQGDFTRSQQLSTRLAESVVARFLWSGTNVVGCGDPTAQQTIIARSDSDVVISMSCDDNSFAQIATLRSQ